MRSCDEGRMRPDDFVMPRGLTRPHTQARWHKGRLGILLTKKTSEDVASPVGDITPETAGEWLSMVARATGYGVTLCDPKRRIVWANDAFGQMSGFSPEEYIGRTPGELLHFENADIETRQRVRESLESGRGLRFESPARSKDGHEWWLDTDARPVLGPQGAVKGWVCIHADVTAEVTKREALRRNESRAHMMIQGGNIGTWEWDARTNLVETNSVYMTMLGYPADDCWHDVNWLRGLCHPDDLEICDRAIHELLVGTRTGFSGNSRLRARDGSFRWVLSSGGVLERGPNGVPTQNNSVMFDVTDHKLADEQTRIVSERMALIAENVPGMIFKWRLSPEGKGEFLYVSPGVGTVFGLTAEVLMSDGAALLAITHPHDCERMRATMRRSAETLAPRRIEGRVVRPDGVISWVTTEAVPRRYE